MANSAQSVKKSEIRRSRSRAEIEPLGDSPYEHLIQADEVKQEELQMLIFSKHSSLVRRGGGGDELAFSRGKKMERKKLFDDEKDEKRRKEEEEEREAQ